MLLWIGGSLLASWASAAMVIAADVRRERRDALHRLNSEYQALCAAEQAS